MSKHRRASTSVVVVAYINIGEAVKVSVQMNLTADMEDQQWWRENYGTGLQMTSTTTTILPHYSMENNHQLEPKGQKGIDAGFPKSPEKIQFQVTFLRGKGNKG